MSRHDNEPVPDIPELVPERDELASYQRQNAKPVKPAKSKPKERASEPDSERSGSSNVLAYVAGAVALAAVGWAGFLHTQLLAAERRVSALEQRLSSTDESVSQSSVALQVKINEVDAALTQLRDDTLKHYKATLDQRGAQIDTLDKTLKTTQSGLAKVEQQAADSSKALDTARAQIDRIAPLVDASKKKVDEHQASLDALASKVKAVGDNQGKLDSRLSNNEEWVESINTFRKQMNREIVNIKQQVAGGKPTPPPAEGVQ